MITKEEILMGRDREAPLTQELKINLDRLVAAVNIIRKAFGAPLSVSSGYRPPRINARTPGAARNSAHLTCQAVDFWDPAHVLVRFLLQHPELLEQAGLWMEDPARTPVWCHLQTRPALGPGGSRIFLADSQPHPGPQELA